jgi:hypothetical protein
MNTFWLHGDDAPPRPAASASSATSTDVRALTDRIDRLEMICEAMWMLIREKTNLGDEDLLAQMAALDLSDGQADGKVARGPIRCGKCNRPNSRRHDFCIYCGTLIRTKPFE